MMEDPSHKARRWASLCCRICNYSITETLWCFFESNGFNFSSLTLCFLSDGCRTALTTVAWHPCSATASEHFSLLNNPDQQRVQKQRAEANVGRNHYCSSGVISLHFCGCGETGHSERTTQPHPKVQKIQSDWICCEKEKTKENKLSLSIDGEHIHGERVFINIQVSEVCEFI